MIAAHRQTESSSQLAWCEGRRPFGAVLHVDLSTNEPGHNDENAVNIVLGITITSCCLFC